MNTNQRTRWLCVLGLAAASSGCFSNNSDDKGDGNGNGGSSTHDPMELPGVNKAAVATLTRADSCEDLLGKIQDDVIAKIDAQALLLKKGPEYGGGLGYPGVGTGGGFDSGGGVPTDDGVSGPAQGGSAGGAGTGGSNPSEPSPPLNGGSDSGGKGEETGGGAPGPTGHSETNTQVEGVDEADIVKLDDTGKNLYVIHGNTIFALAAWPADSTAITGQASIEGSAQEMFVSGGKAVVFSAISNYGDIVALKNGGVGYSGGVYQPYYYGAPFTKITTLDVTGDTPKVERELYVEGSYLSSRRHGDVVRAIVQGGFHTPPVFNAYVEYTDPWGEKYPQEDIDQQVDDWRERLVASIEATEISDWVPVERERIGGKVVQAKPRCLDFYAPPPALTSYGLTNIVSFDMTDAKSELGGAVILGSADTVYANDASLVLAQRDYRYAAHFLEREQTVLHLFDLESGNTKYHASGFVPGHILNQFSMDVAGDTLRIATTQNIWQSFVEIVPVKDNLADVPMAASRTQTDNRVLTLQADGETLKRIGVSKPLGEDGERIESARFVGDRGYVTTFRQVDPLTVLDLSDPKNPEVLGALHIPGFSEYMHPLDEDHLVTIGRNTDVNGSDIGLLLQIFDVSNALAPKLAFKEAFEPGGWSEANSNHKAFTFWVPEGETDGLLAFPYTAYTNAFTSSLQVFRVSASKGFTRLGAIDHTPLFSACYDMFGSPTNDFYSYNYCQQPEVRRGLFVQSDEDTFVYSVSYGGVVVSSLDALDDFVAQEPLPAPDYDEHRTGDILGGSGGGATPGGTGTAGVGAMIDPAPAPEADGGMAF